MRWLVSDAPQRQASRTLAYRLLPLLFGGCIVYGEPQKQKDGAPDRGSDPAGASSSGPGGGSIDFGGSSGSSSSSSSGSSSGGTSSSSGGSSSSSSGAPGSCVLPWGAEVDEGGSVTAFESSVVPYGGTCESEARTCEGGVLSGSFTAQACAPAVPTLVACQGEAVFTFPECSVPCEIDDAGKFVLAGSPTLVLTYGGSTTINGYCGGRTLACRTEEDGDYICTLGDQAIELPGP